ncbi:type VI secretion system-associated protein TagF [Allorhizobium taibaishanense]|uniref:Type VI secretion system protein ImpM n=1 Tax=Allorhizobium taibaishanense TaxID=887144 RepID=A0A1Q9A9V1_9HYPH|nr:type VI secretion system-associated protein TagF [Allorhizobium taibaishanense]MBB4010031.1 type VI secretion system protein ImpM [Allorhizobium taibaishanense]OLP51641.1 type VI secretion-associated protein [Allorhizobium taibaishanense]
MALRPAPTEKAPVADRIGFFGKLPSHGDFLSEGLERDMVATLDAWIRGGLYACEQEFGAAWAELFAASPPWRFIVEKGVWDGAAHAGVMVPSRDRVGRSFPLIVMAQMHRFSYHPRTLFLDHTWFMAAEGLAESTLTREFDLGRFTENLKRMRLPRPQEDEGAATASKDGTALWWYIDPQTAKPQGLRLSGQPKPEDFLRLFRQSTAARQPAPAAPQAPSPASPVPARAATAAAPVPPPQRAATTSRPVTARYSYASHAGTRFSINADGLFLCDKPAVFAIADGVGDDTAAQEAARHTAGQFAGIDDAGDPEGMLQAIKGKLGRANSLLLARSQRTDGSAPAASVVVASVVADQLVLVWAGDARAYLLRDGTMVPLTRDHVSVGLQKRLRRGVGLEQQFLPETSVSAVSPGDRLLLCSYPLVQVLSERTVAEILQDCHGSDGAEQLVQEALIANVRENVSAILIDPAPQHAGS